MASKILIGYDQNEVSSYLNGSLHFWGIDKTVGWGCPNNWEDVMLIQYMLSAAWWLDNLKCDGIFGPKTASTIVRWQQTASLGLRADGRISPVDGTRLRSTTTNKIYTMLAINAEMAKHMPILYKNIRIDDKLPAKLRDRMSQRGKGGYGSIKGTPQTLIN
jgi:hypothetical protein